MKPYTPAFFVHHLPFRFFNPLLWGIWGYLLILMVFGGLETIGENFFGAELLFSIFLSYTLFEALRFALASFERHLIKKGPLANPLGSVTQMLALGLVCSLAIISAEISLYFTVVVGYSTFKAELLAFNHIYGFAALVYTGVYATFHLLFRQNQDLLKAEAERKETLQLRWNRQLRLLQPTFLFETLEVLIPLSQHQPHEAETLITHLSEVYRYQLQHEKKELVPLPKEWETAQTLAAILMAQHPHCLQFNWHTPEKGYEAFQLVPGSLLRLIQQVARQLILHPSLAVTIDINVTEQSVQISFPLQEKLQKTDSGLIAELEQEYKRVTNEPLVMMKAYGKWLWKIPVILPDAHEKSPMFYNCFSGNF